MRSLADTKSRWEETFRDGSGIADLQRAVKFNGPNSPCAAGLRSVCWKAFLLWRNAPAEQWPELAREARAAYSALCDQHLRFIRHPEQLAALTLDPLADDPDSPWNAVRNDETVRAEILQDVRRLPDEPFYHEEPVQAMILDILFLYCKLNPGIGGYRQGMHELLAPIVWVVAQDSVDRATALTDDPAEALLAEMLDPTFVEHDAFALFSKLMESASTFYEVESGTDLEAPQRNTIVERSKYIHEVALMKIDEELANHLRNIEVLPQIFLIRWIRLLFGREFEFDQLLTLWDTIFAYDSTLELIDLICVAMLLRIRWTLLEADYSVALQLMLKYPAPPPPHGPHTFVDDAMYLKDHFDAAGGVTLIFKYTGKSPANTSVTTPTPSRIPTPSFQKFNSLRQRTLGARAPLSTSARILQQPGGVEALLQGAAKNMMERGEKLGINQAVRDAMGEFRRNVQGFQETRGPSRGGRGLFGEAGPSLPDHSLAITLMERRNSRLAAMLDESVTNLKLLAASGFEGEKEQHLETIEMAAAKVQFVRACLEDPTLALPEEELPALNTLAISSPTEISAPTVALDTTPVVLTSTAVKETRTALSTPESSKASIASPPKEPPQPMPPVGQPDEMDTDYHDDEEDTLPPLKSEITNSPPLSPPPPPISEVLPDTPPPPPPPIQTTQRPNGPIPTRSTLAQSSFAWMLEPDTTISSLPRRTHSASLSSVRPPGSGGVGGPGGGGFSSGAHQKKRGNPSRERNAFLFGEVTADAVVGEGALSADQIFGLQPMRKAG
ncbi:rab-GTPase-TBC domain-containing protein [Parachaetomium inaequale]|uniref:Rab-GTPase-TBC domain-containing protein n=1 Tax=Parachaetomium inaequale TaxID=2588326 RepID=A0AAN6PSE5_9PEZI|nr:rab-GTPase-TBC domain-containing protein [Parachaetomium inaequale]